MLTNRKPFTLLAGGALLALGGCAAQSHAPAPAASAPVGAATVTPGDMYARIAFLASDALRGRDTPSQGLEAAAAYLASEYRRLGLEPAGEAGSFYQRYPFARWSLEPGTVHFGTVVGEMEDNRMLAYGTDFYAVPGASTSNGDMGHARLVWVGELGEGGLPPGEYAGTAPVVAVPGSYSRAWRAAAARAQRQAQEAGASALVLVAAPDFSADDFAQLAERSRGEVSGVPASDAIPVFYLTHSAAAGVVERSGRTLASLPASPNAPLSLEGVQAHFAAARRVQATHRVPNVVAVLPGSDPALRDEYVVLSAHMDHVGVGRPVNGDSIYNGADDDASGTSALVEVAEALASLPERPRRSVVFLHVSGEEHGLLGSRWFSDHPTVPLERIVANINVDMIARNAPDSVVVIGKEYSSLGAVVNRVGERHPELGLVVADDIWPEERFFFRSDHFNFARKEIPAIFFFTGVHEDYHRPSDEVERIDPDKAARVARLIFYTAREIANDPQRPTWDPAGLEEVRSLTR